MDSMQGPPLSLLFTIGLRRVNLNNYWDVEEDFEPWSILRHPAKGEFAKQHWSRGFVSNSMWVWLTMAWIYTIVPWCWLVAKTYQVLHPSSRSKVMCSPRTSITLFNNELARGVFGNHQGLTCTKSPCRQLSISKSPFNIVSTWSKVSGPQKANF